MLSRRFFLFGMAASVAAVKASLATDLVEMVAVDPIRYPRWLTGLAVAATGNTREPGDVFLHRGDDIHRPILHFSVLPGSFCHWHAPPYNGLYDIADLGNPPMVVEVLGALEDDWDVHLFWRHGDDHYMERHRFPLNRGGLLERLPVEA